MSKNPIYLVKLSCGHKAATRVLLVNQYPSDEHYVFCPSCRQTNRAKYNEYITAWVQPVAFMEVKRALYNVLRGIAYLMPEDFMRLQPSKPAHRQRPYYYYRGRV